MNRYTYIIIFLFFGLHTQANGMNFAYFMNKLTTTAFFATVYGYYGYKGYFYFWPRPDDWAEKLPNSDHETIEFIHQTLQKYGYPESFYKNITFKESVTYTFTSFTTIAMPISAQKLKDEYNIQDKFRHQGLTKRPNQFYLWQNDILHEASHASCHDTYRNKLAPLVCPLVVHYSGKKISNFLRSNISFLHNTSNIARGLATVPCLALKFAITIGLLHALRKYQEYRADYNIINRVTNPEALEEQAQDYNKRSKEDENRLQWLKERADENLGAPNHWRFKNSYEKFSQKVEFDKKHPWLKKLRDEYQDNHPRDSVREAYFSRAAQNLRKK